MNRKKLKEGMTVVICSLVLAIAFNTSSLPLEIVTGGSSGLSIICQHLFGIEPAIVVFICYAGALAIGRVFLGKDKIKRSVLGTFVYPLSVYLTSPLSNYIKSLSLGPSECLIIVLFGAIISGIAYGFVFKIDYTTGGSDIAAQIINKYTGMTMGTSSLVMNTIIVTSGGALFGWTKVMYAVLTLYVIGMVTDRFVLGISYSKAFYIITDKVDEVREYIHHELKQKTTEFDAVGGYTNHGSQVVMCVVPTRDYFKFKESISLIDKQAFFVIMDAYELESRL